NEGELRYALSCIMTFDKNGERLDYEICESVIESRHRMTYTEVTAILEGDKKLIEKYADVAEDIKNMEKLCLALEKRRQDNGSVTLDVKEAHIYVNDEGEIVIPPAERTISQRIIEQFMISANEAVAEFLLKRDAPCLYRVHESPAREKFENFISFLKDLGVKTNGFKDDVRPKDFQNILTVCEDKPFYSIVNKVMLRSMQKARYSEENLGHFGLASSCYCHFTSPIRRYPDLFVHRSVKDILHGGSYGKVLKRLAHDAGIDCSQRERIADECERKVDELYKLAYMSERIGEEFEATVSGVTSFGVFCELDNTVEGLIPLEDLPADEYVFYEDKYLLKGSKNSFKLGNKLKVRVADCDLGRLRVLFKVL
ncbi:MAG: RNB domain-containing ribonuclease, partial [Clostridia bacterium]|nr:RNB domain-containing ribonuclease [Clostridia bacterium]